MNEKLNNRKKVEKLLAPTVERLTISPKVVKKISEGPVDEAYVQALNEMQRRSHALEKAGDLKDVKAAQDLQPLLAGLADIVCGAIYDSTGPIMLTTIGCRTHT